MTGFTVDTIELDLPALAVGFSRRLREAGVPVSAERSARFAEALTLVRPVSRRRLYFTARAVLLGDRAHLAAFDAVFAAVFGSGAAPGLEEGPPEQRLSVSSAGGGEEQDAPPVTRDTLHPVLASGEEVLKAKRFDALEPDELVRIHRLMAQMRLAPPTRRLRRARRDRRGETIDMRRTLRGSLRTAGDPMRLARRRRRVVPRRTVLLCDISGSMEPYARAYLQFLASAAAPSGASGTGGAEAFAFATRLTRLTRALHSRNPERAIQRAAAVAPDWSSGTRIGDALKTFNDRHGRRGMARGAVIVIISDGWERGDPALVGREMARLARLAHRIVWVNPRVSAREFAPRAGGMAAALPHCDALVSGHNLAALDEVIAAIAGAGEPPEVPGTVAPEPAEEEAWPSAVPVPGSSVAMPSGYGPSRGRTTPGWSLGS
jgi:uncharacterized protein with von Willebrand factor type A (vWA) domain